MSPLSPAIPTFGPSTLINYLAQIGPLGEVLLCVTIMTHGAQVSSATKYPSLPRQTPLPSWAQAAPRSFMLEFVFGLATVEPYTRPLALWKVTTPLTRLRAFLCRKAPNLFGNRHSIQAGVFRCFSLTYMVVRAINFVLRLLRLLGTSRSLTFTLVSVPIKCLGQMSLWLYLVKQVL